MIDKLSLETPPVDFWRSLRYFNLYRLAIAGLLLLFSAKLGPALSLDARSWPLLFSASVIYTVAAVISFIQTQLRWPRFTLQLAGQIGGDIIILSVISYASGGIQNNIGLLLLISLAAAGMISRGKITLFFAAMASIAALIEHSYAVLHNDAMIAQYVQVGLLCVSYFAVAWLAHTLAKYAVDSQLLAQRRGHDLASLSEASSLVMRDMQDGVLVVDEHGAIMQMNPSAVRLLQHSATPGSMLSDNFPLLFGQYALWKRTGSVSRNTLQLDVGVQAKLRFVAVERDVSHGVVIFLEDMQRVIAEAQQIKLAALGRLTANIAHEVRNPLSAISYAAEMLNESVTELCAKPTPASAVQMELDYVNRLLRIVLDNSQRINRIVQNVMQLNQRDRAQPEMLKLDTILGNFSDDFSLSERLAPGVIALSGAQGTEVLFDRGHFRQVLWNLCRNALRHGRKLPGSLSMMVHETDGRVILDVQDDGAGVPEEHQGKLFEPFFTTATDGTGLGLYIAKELCEANGALLEYHHQSGRAGACFRVTFGKVCEVANEYGE